MNVEKVIMIREIHSVTNKSIYWDIASKLKMKMKMKMKMKRKKEKN